TTSRMGRSSSFFDSPIDLSQLAKVGRPNLIRLDVDRAIGPQDVGTLAMESAERLAESEVALAIRIETAYGRSAAGQPRAIVARRFHDDHRRTDAGRDVRQRENALIAEK